MTNNNNNVNILITILLTIPVLIKNAGISIYSTIVLVNNLRDIVTFEVYVFVIVICIIEFLKIIETFYDMFIKKIKTILPLISLGMFIWSCVILFAQNGINYKLDNPYYMIVFIYFISSIIVSGILVIIIPSILLCCYTIYYESSQENNNLPTSPQTISVISV
jgi:hypothetical protein